jgi:6-pyruvoyltetrahydropterin/6-carboxytetrahydropterin synthase
MGLFVVTEEHIFRASHSLKMANGLWEPSHEHDWLVKLWVSAKQLDEQQLVADFIELQKHLHQILLPFENRDLNEIPPFCDGVNPSTEYIAGYLFQKLAPLINTERVTLFRVGVREAPTSWGMYEILTDHRYP